MSTNTVLQFPSHRIYSNDSRAEQLLILMMCKYQDETIPMALDILEPDDFSDKKHAAFFEAIIQLYKEKTNLSLETISERILLNKRLDGNTINSLWFELNDHFVSSAVNKHYISKVKEFSIRRKSIKKFNETIKILSDRSIPIDDIFSDLKLFVDNLNVKSEANRLVPISEGIQEYIEYLQELEENEHGHKYVGYDTGINDLDFLTMGLRPGSQIIIAGRPGQGKTSLAMTIANHISKQYPVAVFSYEMRRRELIERIVAGISGVSISSDYTGSEYSKIFTVCDTLSKEPKMFIDDSKPTIDQLELRSKRMALEHKIGLLVIDYLQLIPIHSQIPRTTNDKISELSRRLKILAGEIDCPTIVLSQLNREYERDGNRRPKLSDLRDSGAIEQDADLVLFIHHNKKEENLESNIRQLILEKNRHGKTGIVDVVFDQDLTLFRNCEQSEMPF